MLSRKRQDTELRIQNSEGMRIRRSSFCVLYSVFCVLFIAGCRMDMQDQPRYKAYSKGSIRKPVAGTVPRGYLREDKHLYLGKKETTGATTNAGTAPQLQSVIQPPAGTNIPASAMYPDAVDTFPFPITEAIVRRGKERYEIFCGMCHGPTGLGDGMIVRRGFKRPPSYHTDQLRQAPVGHFYDVIVNGWGVMPSYSSMIPVTDRWAIVAYVRALQLSQNPQGTTSTNTTASQNQSSQQQPAESGGRK